ncbi:glycoside hydrolase family 3 N-terminal domain-containing protein [Amycolatopsis sp. YIM 10]|uniref:glycoside hydrolase family 3 N-terminal domain-containing protein n=1 Tax=Amycolatopsis sp. YIM 10 TaxID=2653857 RepID=UPI0012901259|nr:glycoside hydrolase family 3 N-terminal domain-containing protein [Amycolatopsis sp. YIM 10]QFU92548.1 Periplasmic beta-glucosidase precursor [Amycolatopsis sp. YIM 10]
MTDIGKLVGKLDLDQKVAQLTGLSYYDLVDPVAAYTRGETVVDLSRIPEVRPHGAGHLSLAYQIATEPVELREKLGQIQEIVRDVSPFGIGVLVHGEAVSGLVHEAGSQFTTPWGQAATWDPQVPRRIGEIAAQESRALGFHLMFSPVLDLARDLRWGRIHETYGEDAELVSRMGVGFISGMHEAGVLATGKHFLGYGHSLGGLNQAATQLGRRELTDVYAEPFRRAIREAGLSVMMNSYNEVDGIPAAANRWLLTDLLRGELGFDGLTVSDYDSVAMLHNRQHTAATPGAAAVQALEAGLDVELPSAPMFSGLRDEVEAGRISEAVIDRAVERVLAVKARFGLVPEIGPAPSSARPEPVGKAATRGLAREIATKSITLLANDGVLPLAAAAAGRIAVVGPAADEVRIHFGAYSDVANRELPIAIRQILAGAVSGVEASAEVFTDLFQTRLPGTEPAFEESTRKLHPDAVSVLAALRSLVPTVEYHAFGSIEPAADLDEAALAGAVAGADVVIAVVGERTGWVGNHTAGEGRTSADPRLPGNQEQLVSALARHGKRVVTVVVSGRPLLLQAVHDASAAVVLAPLLGDVAGAAIADVLFGRADPGGRLPSSFPRHLGQVPLHHGHPIGSGYTAHKGNRPLYTDLDDNSPLYAFGHGLTWTEFEVSLGSAEVSGDSIVVTGQVTNTGERQGTAVVQLYGRDEVASVVRPVRQLLDFARVELDPGAAADIGFTVPVERLAYTWPDGRRGVEEGDLTLLLGLASDDIRASTTLTVPELVLPRARSIQEETNAPA